MYVSSRCYRAPEINLVEKQYDQACDLWGIGCIIHEMLSYILFTRYKKFDDLTQF